MSSTTTASLQELLNRFLAGDPSAKSALVERAYSRLLVLARGFLGRFPRLRREEETAAILHSALHKINKALDDVRPATARLFFGLAALQIRRILRDLTDAPPAPAPIDKEPHPRPPGPPVTDIRNDVMAALAKLDADERELVDLLFYVGLTQAEAADLLEIHEDTVKRRWAKVKVRLERLLPGYAPEG